MANRRQPFNNRRSDFGRNDRPKSFNRPGGMSPWQGGTPNPGLASLLPLAQGSTDATLALANNLITNLLQTRQNAVPSLLDMPMPIRRDFPPEPMRFDRGVSGYGNNQRMGNQGNFRRSGNYNRQGDRVNSIHNVFRPRDGPRQQNRSAQRKESDKSKVPKESEVKKETTDNVEVKKEVTADKTEKEEPKEGAKKDGNKKEAPKTRYDDVNPSLLKCHICNTSMWDGRSFENHLNGMAHSIMMQKTAEGYALAADTMRQELKIREMKRTRKSRQPTPRDFYCAMCDMFASDGSSHRTTVGHRKLKKYLHPACSPCKKELPTRIELDEHKLTPEHLKKMTPLDLDKVENMVIHTLQEEQANIHGDRPRKHGRDGDEDDAQENPGVVEANDVEGVILDCKEDDDLTGVTRDLFPHYSTERGVGRSFLQEYRCYQCRLCKRLLENEETAEAHLKTKKHYQNYMKMLRQKTPNPAKTADGGNIKAETTNATAGVKSQSGADIETGVKRAISEDDDLEESADWKRKRSNDDEPAPAEEGLDDEVEMGEGHLSPNGDADAAEDAAEEEWNEDWDTAPEGDGQDINDNAGDETLKLESIEVEAAKPKDSETTKPKGSETAKPKGLVPSITLENIDLELEEEKVVEKGEVKVQTAKRGGGYRGSPRGRARGRGRKF